MAHQSAALECLLPLRPFSCETAALQECLLLLSPRPFETTASAAPTASGSKEMLTRNLAESRPRSAWQTDPKHSQAPLCPQWCGSQPWALRSQAQSAEAWLACPGRPQQLRMPGAAACFAALALRYTARLVLRRPACSDQSAPGRQTSHETLRAASDCRREAPIASTGAAGRSCSRAPAASPWETAAPHTPATPVPSPSPSCCCLHDGACGRSQTKAACPHHPRAGWRAARVGPRPTAPNEKPAEVGAAAGGGASSWHQLAPHGLRASGHARAPPACGRSLARQ
mmetsp:Transcript_50456/g.116466  ORF Transcript_50456/g.116466 Transcript_50456/m.116466 type:complete len:284 (-) Transcript_50456:457-1308(-)